MKKQLLILLTSILISSHGFSQCIINLGTGNLTTTLITATCGVAPTTITINTTGAGGTVGGTVDFPSSVVTVTLNGTLDFNNNNDGLNFPAGANFFVGTLTSTGVNGNNPLIYFGSVPYSEDDFAAINVAGVVSAAGALPISLLSFTGKPTNNAIALRWETASEKDNAYIAVERSKDGVNFVELHQEKGFGTTSEPKSYRWTDPHPFAGVNYYRLRQVDYDGKFEYHPIIAVLFDGKTSDTGIRLYPTEVKDRVNIQLDTPPTEDATLLVVDLTGRILQRERITAGTVQHELQLNQLTTGQYFVTLQSDKTVQTVRFIKL